MPTRKIKQDAGGIYLVTEDSKARPDIGDAPWQMQAGSRFKAGDTVKAQATRGSTLVQVTDPGKSLRGRQARAHAEAWIRGGR